MHFPTLFVCCRLKVQPFHGCTENEPENSVTLRAVFLNGLSVPPTFSLSANKIPLSYLVAHVGHWAVQQPETFLPVQVSGAEGSRGVEEKLAEERYFGRPWVRQSLKPGALKCRALKLYQEQTDLS